MNTWVTDVYIEQYEIWKLKLTLIRLLFLVVNTLKKGKDTEDINMSTGNLINPNSTQQEKVNLYGVNSNFISNNKPKLWR